MLRLTGLSKKKKKGAENPQKGKIDNEESGCNRGNSEWKKQEEGSRKGSCEGGVSNIKGDVLLEGRGGIKGWRCPGITGDFGGRLHISGISY